MPETDSLFSDPIEILPGMTLLPGFAQSDALHAVINRVCDESPLRHMVTRRGQSIQVAMTNCGAVGWVSDTKGYRYTPTDPLNDAPWPAMPTELKELAKSAALLAGFSGFEPDACLINRYQSGVQMGAHQDRDEQDFTQPIVSVSLGIPARFFVLGLERKGTSVPVDLSDGDVVVFGGPARLFYHGVRKLKPASDPIWGSYRWNLTFRKAM